MEWNEQVEGCTCRVVSVNVSSEGAPRWKLEVRSEGCPIHEEGNHAEDRVEESS